MTRTIRRTGLRVVAVALTIALASGCVHESLHHGVLTPDGGDRYDLLSDDDGATIDASAPTTNTGGNLRWVFWRRNAPVSSNQESCATWSEGDITTNQQMGAALRIRHVDGRTSAITVTRNIYLGFWGIFNFHVMDSGANPAFTQIGSATVPSLASRPYPWRFCARVIGNQVSFRVWAVGDAEPAYGTPGAGGSATVPAAYVRTGAPGYYVGHLRRGESVSFTNLLGRTI